MNQSPLLTLLPEELQAHFRSLKIPLFDDVREEYDFLAQIGKVEILRALHDIETSQIKIRGRYPIYRAAMEGQLQTIGFLLDARYSPTASPPDTNHTPLTVAISRSHIRVALLLVEVYPSVNALQQGQAAPLEEAIKIGSRPLIRKLLKHGANLTNKSWYWTVIYHFHDVVELFIEQMVPPSPIVIRWTIQYSSVEILKLILESYPQLLNTGLWLHQAVIHGNSKMLKYLLEKGLCDRPDEWKRTALEWALTSCEKDKITLMQKYGSQMPI